MPEDDLVEVKKILDTLQEAKIDYEKTGTPCPKCNYEKMELRTSWAEPKRLTAHSKIIMGSYKCPKCGERLVRRIDRQGDF